MSALATVAAVAVTIGGIGRLAATDPKRRRSFGLAPYRGNRKVALALTAVLLPGVLLLAIGTGADFVAWLGTVCVGGWGVAAVSPLRTARIVGWIAAVIDPPRRLLAAAIGGGLRPAAGSGPAGGDGTLRRIAELERRMGQLEAALDAQQSPPGAGDDRRAARLAESHGAESHGAKAQR